MPLDRLSSLTGPKPAQVQKGEQTKPEFASVLKSNPYHDADGKFSSKENDSDGKPSGGHDFSKAHPRHLEDLVDLHERMGLNDHPLTHAARGELKKRADETLAAAQKAHTAMKEFHGKVSQHLAGQLEKLPFQDSHRYALASDVSAGSYLRVERKDGKGVSAGSVSQITNQLNKHFTDTKAPMRIKSTMNRAGGGTYLRLTETDPGHYPTKVDHRTH